MTYKDARELKPGDIVVYTFPRLMQYHGSVGIVEGHRPLDWGEEESDIPRPVIAWVSSNNGLAIGYNHKPFHEDTLTKLEDLPGEAEYVKDYVQKR